MAIRILSSESLHLIHNTYAGTLLKTFVTIFKKLYKADKVSYNVHGLIHIARDVKNNGPMESYSCYPFESFIKKIKRMIHSKNRPLEQVHNRVHENVNLLFNSTNPSKIKDKNQPEFSNFIYGSNKFYKAIFSKFTIRANKVGDNCVMLTYNSKKVIIRVNHFEKNKDSIHILGKKICNIEPLDNLEVLLNFDILVGNFEEKITRFSLNTSIIKMCCLPYDHTTKFIVTPFIHL